MTLEDALKKYAEGDYEGALRIVESEKGTSYKHLFLKGLCLLRLGKHGDAKISLEKAVSLETEPEIYHYLGLVELYLKNPKKALLNFEKVKPPTTDSLLLSAFAHLVLGNKEEAVKLINKALELNPAKVAIFANILSQGEYLPTEEANDLLILLSEAIEKSKNKKKG